MKLIMKKKKKRVNDPIKMINDCIIGLDEIKKKIYDQNEEIKLEYYSDDEIEEYVNWGSSFKLKDFVR